MKAFGKVKNVEVPTEKLRLHEKCEPAEVCIEELLCRIYLVLPSHTHLHLNSTVLSYGSFNVYTEFKLY